MAAKHWSKCERFRADIISDIMMTSISRTGQIASQNTNVITDVGGDIIDDVSRSFNRVGDIVADVIGSDWIEVVRVARARPEAGSNLGSTATGSG